jgi:hypothetical protein
MPGKSQPYSDAVLNVLRGTAIAGVSPYVGLFSVAHLRDDAVPPGTELAGNMATPGRAIVVQLRR